MARARPTQLARGHPGSARGSSARAPAEAAAAAGQHAEEHEEEEMKDCVARSRSLRSTVRPAPPPRGAAGGAPWSYPPRPPTATAATGPRRSSRRRRRAAPLVSGAGSCAAAACPFLQPASEESNCKDPTSDCVTTDTIELSLYEAEEARALAAYPYSNGTR